MKTLNIITESSSWIMDRAARELSQGAPPYWQVTLNAPVGKADVDYFLPYLTYHVRTQKKKKSKVAVGYFTHLENPKSTDPNIRRKAEKFKDFRRRLDHCIAISHQTRQELFADKYCPIIKMGCDVGKVVTFGVCGKVHSSGRKNENFIRQLVKDGINLLAWGEGWPCKILSSNPSDLHSFYNQIDFLIIPSAIEGGPVPVLEAISMGVPVIAPDVGWCWEYPVIRYEKNSYDSLKAVISGLNQKRTWLSWQEEHFQFFDSLIKSL